MHVQSLTTPTFFTTPKRETWCASAHLTGALQPKLCWLSSWMQKVALSSSTMLIVDVRLHRVLPADTSVETVANLNCATTLLTTCSPLRQLSSSPIGLFGGGVVYVSYHCHVWHYRLFYSAFFKCFVALLKSLVQPSGPLLYCCSLLREPVDRII